MNRIAASLLVLLLCLSLTACAKKEETPAYRDGTYTAQAGAYDDGWMDTVTITVNGGRITGADWDAVNEDGGPSKKELSESGGYDMVAGGARSQWHEQAASMEKALVDAGSPDNIKLKDGGYADAVSGVTIRVNKFVELARLALEGAE